MQDKERLNLGVQLFYEQKYELALNALKPIDKTSGEIWFKKQSIIAATLSKSNKLNEALEILNELELERSTAETISIRGITLRAMGKLQEALDVLSRGADEYPDSFDIAHNLAITATDLGKFALAIEKSELVAKLNPTYAETYKNLGRIFITIRDSDRAFKAFSKLEELVGLNADVLIGKGACELINDNYAEAANYFKKALAIDQRYGSAWGNLGLCLKLMGKYVEAEKCLHKAIEVDPSQVEHPWNLALIQLALGNQKEGWKNYEVRFDPRRIATDRVVMPKTPVPMLQNEHTIKGKTVVLLQEQGFGDALQFYRYAKDMKEEGVKKIYAIVSKELINVVRTIPWLDEVRYELTSTEVLPDYWVYPMSLPNRYQNKYSKPLPAPIPYIFSTQSKREDWKNRLNREGNKKIRIGLLWAGRETHTNDKNRSMSLDQLDEFAKYADQVEFISIQKGKKAEQGMAASWIRHSLGDKIQDFSDTAGLFANLDLLISIDSAPVHLAGAMGMPVWVLLPNVFDFRWMIDREDSPWYPHTLRLFRQNQGENWEPVVLRLAGALDHFIATHDQRWMAKSLNLSEPRLKTHAAGIELYLQSAYDSHVNGDLQAAYEMYQLVLQYDASNIDALRNMASICRTQGAFVQALEIYRHGESREFNDPIFYSNYSNLLLQLKDHSEAIRVARKAIDCDSKDIRPWIVLTDSLNQLGYKKEALVEIDRSLILFNTPEQLIRKISLKLELNQLSSLAELLAQLQEYKDYGCEFYLLRAQYHQVQGNYDLALLDFNQAIELKPDYYESYMNRGIAHAEMHNFDAAIEDTKHSVRLNPNNAEGLFNLALYQLATGNYSEGWKNYEYRMDPRRTVIERVRTPELKMPMWQGEPIKDKTILLMPEQGYGDYIQFIRYAKWLKEQGAMILAAVPAPLKALMQSCVWIDKLVSDGDAIRYDYWVFPMSLPYRAKTKMVDIPVDIPYLFSEAGRLKQWQAWMKKRGIVKSKPLIGICWQGARTHRHDARRSISPDAFRPLLGAQDDQFIAIIKEEGCSEVYDIGGVKIHNAGYEVNDFADTAAIIHELDVLISIDSAPVHVAGAMGKPVMLLLDSLCDFRWFTDKTESPWYPSVSIYRKGIHEKWPAVIEQISLDLKEFK